MQQTKSWWQNISLRYTGNDWVCFRCDAINNKMNTAFQKEVYYTVTNLGGWSSLIVYLGVLNLTEICWGFSVRLHGIKSDWKDRWKDTNRVSRTETVLPLIDDTIIFKILKDFYFIVLSRYFKMIGISIQSISRRKCLITRFRNWLNLDVFLYDW